MEGQAEERGKRCSRRVLISGHLGSSRGHLGASPPSGKTCSRASAMLSANQRGCSERQIGSYLKAISRSSRGHLGCSERQIGSSSKDTKGRGGGRERVRVVGSPRGEGKGCEHG